MTDVVFWAALSAVCAIVVALGGFLTRLASRITANKITAEAAHNSAAAAMLRIDILTKEMADQREASARHLGQLEATNQALTKAWEVTERRLAESVEEMSGSLRHLSDRLDRLIDHMTNMSK